MRLALYTRRSTDAQVASPQTQHDACLEYCARNGHEIVRVFHEAPLSGKTELEHRTALPELIAAVKNPKREFDGIIVWRTDRLCRNPGEFHRLLAILDKYKCALVSVMDPVKRNTAAERFMTSVLADAAAYERELIAERVYAHHVTAFLRGKWPGGPQPLGLRWNREHGRFDPSDRADDVATVFRVYVEYNGSSKRAVEALNAMNLPSPRGGLWSGTALLCVLRNPMYRRRMVYAGHEIDAKAFVPEIVDPDLVRQVDALLSLSRERAFHPRTIASKRAYSGLLRCSQCGAVLTSGGRETEMREYRNWQCSHRRAFRTCNSRQLANTYIDTLMGHAIQRLLANLRDPINNERLQSRSVATKVIPQRQRQRDRLTVERTRTVDLYVKGYIGEAEFRERVQRIDAQIAELTADIPASNIEVTSAALFSAIETLAYDWPFVPESEKRALLLQLRAEVTVNTSGTVPFWIELRTVLNSDSPIRVSGILRGKWPVRILSTSS